MLAAFSVPLDQSNDGLVIAQCLEGFRHAIHVTAAVSMKTHRDAFVTSLAKFTSLHSPADIKQKNIDAIKCREMGGTNSDKCYIGTGLGMSWRGGKWQEWLV
ncbi:Brefeldin A-inhibited guanine nucleotide-exchange protein 2-like [Forsythia ovata]|uniref:Brefeldin A-inhibited guanine nucleotide-exchange protein 2-like n=1 Tax=Forsythia ovata TaxID=205694 RepID=A0ABD1WTG0_9LAMI